MKVKELIENLKVCNQEAEVKYSDYCGNWEFSTDGFDDSNNKILYLVGDHD